MFYDFQLAMMSGVKLFSSTEGASMPETINGEDEAAMPEVRVRVADSSIFEDKKLFVYAKNHTKTKTNVLYLIFNC